MEVKMMSIDEKYMRRCLQLAACGRQLSRPNPMVGAVIVAPSEENGEDCSRIIGEGYHVRCGEGHAEVNAFASVCAADEHLLPQSTIYVSLEPCAHFGKTPPCADLIVSKKVGRVVVGCLDIFSKVQGRGIQKIRDAGIFVTVGVLEAECQWLNRRFFTFHKYHRPYIILKWAQSKNGFIDDHQNSVALSTPFTQMLVHKLRASEDAILVGRKTDEREHPQLTVRHWCGPSPQRFVLGHGRTIDSVLSECYERNLQSLIVEGGACTHLSFIQAGLWDDLRVEISSKEISDGTRAVDIPPQAKLTKSLQFGNNIIKTYLNAGTRQDI